MKKHLSVFCIFVYMLVNIISLSKAYAIDLLSPDINSINIAEADKGIVSDKNFSKVRVAMIINGNFMFDTASNPSGYAVDYLTAISKYTGWHYEYVSLSYKNAIEALENGDIDIICGVNEELVSKYNVDLSKFCMGYSSYVICTIDNIGNNVSGKLNRYSDYSIGYISNSLDRYCNREYIENNYDFRDIVAFDTYDSMIDALHNKRVDCILISELDYIDSYKIIAEFSPYPVYIATKKDSITGQQLNNAQSNIYLNDKYLNDNLYKKYYSKKSYLSTFTQDEVDYLNSIDSLNVYISSNRGILFESDNGQYSGIQYDMIKYISNELGTKINIITQNEASVNDFLNIISKDDIDLYAGYTHDIEWAQKNEFYITNPYMNMNYYKIQRIDSTVSSDSRTSNEIVAAIPYYRLTNEIISTNYSKDQIVWKNNDLECINAVSSGEADVAYINTYSAEYYLNSYDFQTLSMRYIDYSNSICFAIPKNRDKRLVDIINKVITKLSYGEMENIIGNNITKKRPVHLMKAFFIENTLLCGIVLIVFLTMLIFLITLSIVNRIISKKNKQLILVTNAKNEFFSRASHDIRTPMSSIIGLSEIGMNEENDEMKKQYFKQIDDTCKYLLGILNDTLDIGRLESKSLILNKEPVKLKDFITQINRIVINKANEKNITFNIINNNKDDSIYAYFDKVHTFQIFVNLITNAIKFTPCGGYVNFIIGDVSYNKNDIYNIEFHVIDNGIGISESFLPHIFESFSQENTDEASYNNGTGLGLTIVKNLVELMNGEISVKTEKGLGTDFKVIIPTLIIKMDNEEQINSNNDVDDIKRYESLMGKKALIVEDNELNGIIIEKILDAIGIQSDVCLNGLKAIETFNKSEISYYDIILMDKRMPVMDGATAINEIRSMKRLDALSTPIIILTADVIDENDYIKTLKVDGYIMKPIVPEKLYDMILNLCKNKK